MKVAEIANIFESDTVYDIILDGERVWKTFISKELLETYGQYTVNYAAINFDGRGILLDIGNIIPCDCYKTRVVRKYLTEYERGLYAGLYNKEVTYINQEESYCLGTKECDICSCGGNRSKCDFYEKVREENK